MGLIYKATFKGDANKVYIGKTSLTLEERKRLHEQNKKRDELSVHSFDRALIEEGLKNWDWEILEDNIEGSSLLDKKEREYITVDRKNGFQLYNEHHNPDHPSRRKKSEVKVRASKKGASMAWDSKNDLARTNRYYQLKTIPVINMTTKRTFEFIRDAAKEDSVSTQKIHKLCNSGEPDPRKGYQYAKLSIDGEPIYEEGHRQKYPILRQVVAHNYETNEELRGTIFELSKKLGCEVNNLTVMSCLGLGGTRNNIRHKGFLVYATDEDGNKILTDQHKKKLNDLEMEKQSIYIWTWVRKDKDWEYESEVKGINQCSQLIAARLNKNYKNITGKIKEILRGKRTNVNIYTFTDTTRKPTKVPLIKNCPVVLLGNPNQVFESAKVASLELVLDPNQIVNCCRGGINTTGGHRFAYADDKGDPVFTKTHKKFQRNDTGSGTSLLWVQEGRTFKSVAEFHRHLKKLYDDKDPRILLVPTPKIIKEILDGQRPDKFGKDDTGFRLNVRPLS
jgi:hypothetical protein